MRRTILITTFSFLLLAMMGAAYAEGCFGSVKSVPATCEGGMITKDLTLSNGCRAVYCQAERSVLQVLACNKPGDYWPQSYEVYRQTIAGSAQLTLCVGDACLKKGTADENGYAAGTLPYCANQTGNGTACYASVREQAPRCIGGSLTEDEWVGGCRELVCENGSASMTVKACDHTEAGKSHTEMYQLFKTGTLDFCLGDTCFGDDGFARGAELPVCGATGGTTPNGTNGTTGNASIRIVPEVTVDHNAAFECVTPGFSAAQYEWSFGDGKTAVKSTSSVSAVNQFWPYYYHTYTQNGTYTVTCTARNGSQTRQGTRQITISTEATPAEIAATLPANDTEYWNPYVFRPVVRQVNGSTYDVGGYAIGLPRDPDGRGQNGYWAFTGPFSSQYTSTHNNILRIAFPQPGNYTFHPNAGINNDIYTPEQYNWGSAKRGCSNPRTLCHDAQGPTVNITVPDLGTRSWFGIKADHVGNTTYDIRCASYATDAGAKSRIDFGDATPWATDVAGDTSVRHTYPANGSFEITCWQPVEHGMDQQYRKTIDATGASSNASGAPPNSTCYTPVAQRTPQCVDSDLTSQQPVDGCMQYVCTSSTGNLTVKACDQPAASATPYYFQMFKTVQSGSGPGFCLDGTCFNDSGFARSPDATC